MSYGRYMLEGTAYDVAAGRGGNALELSIGSDGDRRTLTITAAGELVHVNGRSYKARTARAPGGHEIHVDLNGEIWTVTAGSRLEVSGDAVSASGTLVTAVPGQIVTVRVRAGDLVSEGDELLVLESMKIYSRIVAPFVGTVVELAVHEGAIVEKGSLLIRLERSESALSPGGIDAAD